MISFLQKILQKHHKWLFSILLVVVTISFVFTVGSSPGIGRSSYERNAKIFGVNLSSQKEIDQWMQETELSAQLKGIFIGLPQLKDFALFARLATLKLADDLGIPNPNRDQLNKYVESYSEFYDESRKFDASKYNQYLSQLSKNREQQGIFEQTIVNDLRCLSVEKLLFDQGCSLPAEAKIFLKKENTRYTFAIANFQASSITFNEEITPEELLAYFEENRENYKLGPQINLDYVEFPGEMFLAQVAEPTSQEQQVIYNRNREKFSSLKEDSEALKSAIIDEYKREKSVAFAMSTADQFVYKLYENNISVDSPEFSSAIKSQGIEIKTLDPVTLDDVSHNELFSPEALSQCAKLDANRYYSDPVISKQGTACVVFFRDRVPEIYSPFDSVRDQVMTDYKSKKNREKFSNWIATVRAEMLERTDLNNEKFLEGIESHGAKVEIYEDKMLAACDIAQSQKDVLQTLHQGTISEIIDVDPNTQSIIFLEKKEAPEHFKEEDLSQITQNIENLDRKLFQEYLLETIFSELNIKDADGSVSQQYGMIASIYFSQFDR